MVRNFQMNEKLEEMRRRCSELRQFGAILARCGEEERDAARRSELRRGAARRTEMRRGGASRSDLCRGAASCGEKERVAARSSAEQRGATVEHEGRRRANLERLMAAQLTIVSVTDVMLT